MTYDIDLSDDATIATFSPCCRFLRLGDHPPKPMHSGLCRSQNGGELGPTIKLVIHPDDRGWERAGWTKKPPKRQRCGSGSYVSPGCQLPACGCNGDKAHA